MASAGGVRAGKTFVEAYLDASKLERGLNQALGTMRSFASGLKSIGTNMAVLGGAIIGPLLFGARALMKLSDEIGDVQNNTNLSVEAIQRMTIGSEKLGVASGVAASALATMGGVIGRAMDGNKRAIKTIEDLGLSLEGLKAAAPDHRMRLVFDSLRNIEDPALRLARGTKILGSGFKELGDIFKMNEDEFNSLTAKLEKGGLFLSQADVEAGQAMTRSWVEIKTAVTRLAATLAAVFTPAMTTIINKAVDIVVNFKAWSKENKGLIAVVLALGAGLLVLGTALSAIGVALGGIVAVVAALAKFAGVVIRAAWSAFIFASTMGGLRVEMSRSTGMVLGFLKLGSLDQVFHRLGLTLLDLSQTWKFMAGVVGTTVWLSLFKSLEYLNAQILKANNGIQSFSEGFKIAFRDIGESISRVVKGFGDAISLGEVGIAFKIAWIGIKLSVLEVLASIPKAVMSVLTNIGTRILDFSSMLITSGIEVLAMLPKAMAYAWYAMVKVFEWAMGKITKFKEVAANKLAEIWILATTLASGGTMEEAGQKLLMLDEMHNAEMAAIQAETDAKMKGVEAEQAAALQQLEDLKNSSITAVDETFRAWQAGIMEMNGLMDEVADEWLGISDLTTELTKLEQELARLKWLKEHQPLGGMQYAKVPTPEAIKPVDLQARGQFGGWSTLGMQAMGPMDKLTKAAQETADNTAYIADNMGDGGLAVE